MAQICRIQVGRACPLCPGISGVDLFGYREGIIYLDAEHPHGSAHAYSGGKRWPPFPDRISTTCRAWKGWKGRKQVPGGHLVALSNVEGLTEPFLAYAEAW